MSFGTLLAQGALIWETVLLRRLAGMTEQSTQQRAEQAAGVIGSSRAEAVEGPLNIGKGIVDPSLITG